jgi:hypothetical protein
MAVSVGAGNYLVKGQITPDSLERSIRHTLERTRMLYAVRESEEHFRLLLDGFGEHATFLLNPTAGDSSHASMAVWTIDGSEAAARAYLGRRACGATSS